MSPAVPVQYLLSALPLFLYGQTPQHIWCKRGRGLLLFGYSYRLHTMCGGTSLLLLFTMVTQPNQPKMERCSALTPVSSQPGPCLAWPASWPIQGKRSMIITIMRSHLASLQIRGYEYHIEYGFHNLPINEEPTGLI